MYIQYYALYIYLYMIYRIYTGAFFKRFSTSIWDFHTQYTQVVLCIIWRICFMIDLWRTPLWCGSCTPNPVGFGNIPLKGRLNQYRNSAHWPGDSEIDFQDFLKSLKPLCRVEVLKACRPEVVVFVRVVNSSTLTLTCIIKKRMNILMGHKMSQNINFDHFHHSLCNLVR